MHHLKYPRYLFPAASLAMLAVAGTAGAAEKEEEKSMCAPT